MFKKNDYTYKLLEKENKRLVHENEKLRTQLDEISHLKDEYKNLIEELHGYVNTYKDTLARFDAYEHEMRKEFKRLMK